MNESERANVGGGKEISLSAEYVPEESVSSAPAIEVEVSAPESLESLQESLAVSDQAESIGELVSGEIGESAFSSELVSSELVSSELVSSEGQEPILTKDFNDYTSYEFFGLAILLCLILLVFVSFLKGD